MLLPKQKKNILENGWDYFKIYGNKPNLIPNGWDSFEPYDGAEVKITPLGNGLTRIQTWGGNTVLRLRFATSLVPKEGDIITYSSYIKNIGETQFWFAGIGGSDRIDSGFDNFFIYSFEGNGSSSASISIRSAVGNIGEPLDFIVSEPQLVEGDVPNLTLIKTPLGNGRTRIQTFGGGDNIKLRYEKPFEDKDLTFSTYLENNSDEPMGIKVLDNEEKTYAPNFKGMVEEHGKG